MKAVVAAFNQEKALVGAFSVITNLRMELFQALAHTRDSAEVGWQEVRAVVDCDQVGGHREDGEDVADDDLAVEAVQLGHAAVDHEGEGEEDAADQ